MSSTVVTVFVSSPDTHSERRFDLHLTIGQLKAKLELITGISHDAQVITLLRSQEDSTTLATLDDDSRPLGYYGVKDWQVIKVDDANPSNSLTGKFTDVSQVEKFEISDQQYQERRDTVLAYKQRNKLGRFAEPEEQGPPPAEPEVSIPIGARCEVESSEGGLKRRGTVRFVGPTKFAKGNWVGIEYDEPYGKNDGSVQGERYFTCRPLFGGFVKPSVVKVGDFPPEDLFGDEEEM